MQAINVHCCYPEVVDVLVEGCQAKNGLLAEIAIVYLGEILKQMDIHYYSS